MTTLEQPELTFPSAPVGTSPDGTHWESGRCPNVGSACNCIGACRPRLVRDIAVVDKRSKIVRKIVADDHLTERDYTKFVEALRASASPLGLISQNDLRLRLMEDTVKGPRCSIEPHHYAAFFGRAAAEGLIRKAKRADGRTLKDVCTTSPTGNNGKDQVVWSWIA